MRNSLPGAGFVMCWDICCSRCGSRARRYFDCDPARSRQRGRGTQTLDIGGYRATTELGSEHDFCALVLSCQALINIQHPQTVRNEPNHAAKTCATRTAALEVVLVDFTKFDNPHAIQFQFASLKSWNQPCPLSSLLNVCR